MCSHLFPAGRFAVSAFATATLATALVVVPAVAAQAADPNMAEVLQELRSLRARVEKLEARNAELEKAQGVALEGRVRAIEEQYAREREALANDGVRDGDPALVMRLKDLEIRTLRIQEQARTIDALGGITAGASFVAVAQRAGKASTADGSSESQLNYRGDISVTLPGGTFGDIVGKMFGHFRLGQGDGLVNLRPSFSVPNSTVFRLTHGDESAAALAQAWYQADIPLSLGGVGSASKQHVQVNFGKIDPFVFFDQNAAADDETTRFLNLAFVHNPLLDAGGDIGVDSIGFTPGGRLAFLSDTESGASWAVSAGAFGAGRGASFDRSYTDPLVIGQVEYMGKPFRGLDGNYRFYAWRNGQATPFANEADPTREIHAGWGISVDQKVAEDIVLFGRYGHSAKGNVRFDRAVTVGAEIGGSSWGRGDDALGVAAGWLRASAAFRNAAPATDADGDGNPDFGWQPEGAERVGEIFYRLTLNKHLALTPDFQWIQRPAGDRATGSIKILGLRTNVHF